MTSGILLHRLFLSAEKTPRTSNSFCLSLSRNTRLLHISRCIRDTRMEYSLFRSTGCRGPIWEVDLSPDPDYSEYPNNRYRVYREAPIDPARSERTKDRKRKGRSEKKEKKTHRRRKLVDKRAKGAACERDHNKQFFRPRCFRTPQNTSIISGLCGWISRTFLARTYPDYSIFSES